MEALPLQCINPGWKVVRICDELEDANAQIGLVATLAGPLEQLGSEPSLLLVSTFSTDFAFIRSELAEKALSLDHLGSNFVILRE